jgi:hypothetical protein
MSRVKMKAVDQLHLSELGPDTLQPGQTFETDAVSAKSLEKRGLARRVQAAAKKAALPSNKAAEPLANK